MVRGKADDHNDHATNQKRLCTRERISRTANINEHDANPQPPEDRRKKTSSLFIAIHAAEDSTMPAPPDCPHCHSPRSLEHFVRDCWFCTVCGLTVQIPPAPTCATSPTVTA